MLLSRCVSDRLDAATVRNLNVFVLSVGIFCCAGSFFTVSNLQVEENEKKYEKRYVYPTNIGIARPGAHSLSAATLVVVSDGRGRHLGCYKAFHVTNLSLI